MKNRSTSFVALSCALALTCSCSSTQVSSAPADDAWTKVAAGHYQSASVEPSERKPDDSLRGENPALITYGVFVGAVQVVATVGIVGAAVVAAPFAGGMGGGGCY